MARALKFGHRKGAGDEPLGRMDARLEQLAWFAGVSTVAFLIPLVFSSLLDLHHDLYYFIYFTITLATLGAYVRIHEIDLVQVFTRNWKLSLGVGVASAAFVVWSVLGRIDSTPHPSGAYFAFEITASQSAEPHE